MMSEKPSIVVTGASGFIALHIIRQLLDEGYFVRGTLRQLSRGDSLKKALSVQTDVSHLSFVEVDLMEDKGWDAAMEGAEALIHVASPIPSKEPEDEDELIKPARDGALRALKAAQNAGIKRVVLTSSVAAIYNRMKVGEMFNESDWSDSTEPGVAHSAYAKSKTLAEKAAWDFVAGTDIKLTVINPSVVIGPLIDPDFSMSLEIIRRVVESKTPGWPKLGFYFVDVRDVANAHVKAMQNPEAAGNRYVCANEFLWMTEVAAILRSKLAPEGRKIKTLELPNWMVKLVALFDPSLRMITSDLGDRREIDSSKLRRDLEWKPRDVAQSICDSADSLIAHNIC